MKKKVETVELLTGQQQEAEISQQKMDEVKRRIAYYDKNPHELVSWDEIRNRLKFR